MSKASINAVISFEKIEDKTTWNEAEHTTEISAYLRVKTVARSASFDINTHESFP
jgi:hypothetical protein